MSAKIAAAVIVVFLAGCAGSGGGSSPLSPMPANPSGNHPTSGAVVPNATVYFPGAAQIGTSVTLYGFAVGSGDESPSAQVYGPPSLDPHAVTSTATDAAGDVYVAYSGIDYTIVEFGPNTNGTPTPLRMIAGDNTKLGAIVFMAVAPDGTIFVDTQPFSASCNYTQAINVYGPHANGNVAPDRQLTNPMFGNDGLPLAADATDTVYVGIGGSAGSILAFGPQANGNAAPDRIISGSSTQIQRFPESIAVSPKGVIALYSGGTTAPATIITEYPSSANGNVAPANTIDTSSTGYDPSAIAFDTSGNLYVSTATNPETAHAMLVYSPGASGKATPLTTFIPDVGGYQPAGLTGYFTVSSI